MHITASIFVNDHGSGLGATLWPGGSVGTRILFKAMGV
jgi:hypothetical protein